MSYPRLNVPSFEIREFLQEDAVALASAVQDSQRDIFTWMDWAHENYSIDDARAFIDSATIGRRAATEFDFGLFTQDGSLAGVVSINSLRLDHRCGNIGYWVHTSKTRQGLATAAVKAIAPYGFDTLKLVRLEIVTAEGNHASRKVAEKAGAQFECVARNRLIIHGKPSPAAVYSLIPCVT